MANEPRRPRLHSVEHFMLADSRQSHPMTFFLRVELAEDLDKQRLHDAVVTCVRLHPLLTATVCRHWGHWCWKLPEAGQELAPIIDQHSRGDYCKSRDNWSMDLITRPGLRISLAPLEIWLQVHHSCCDARGLLDFLDDLREQYLSPWSEEAVAGRVREIRQHLSQRAIGFSPGVGSYLNPLGPKWSRISAYFRHRSRPLVGAHGLPGDRGAFVPTCVHRQLRLVPSSPVREGTATVNDLLLQAMFESMAEYQSQHTPAPHRDWLRIGMPIDMRRYAEQPMTACNGSSLVFLDRRTEQILNATSAWTAELERETQHIKQQRLGVVFFDCLEAAHRLPLGMKLAVEDRRCAVASVVSNLGRLHFAQFGERVDEFAVRRIDFLPPLRPGTRLALGAATVDDMLSLTLHYDARHIAGNQATAIVDNIWSRLSGKLLASRNCINL